MEEKGGIPVKLPGGWRRWIPLFTAFIAAAWITVDILLRAGTGFAGLMLPLTLTFLAFDVAGVLMASPLLLSIGAGVSYSVVYVATFMALPATIVGWMMVTGPQVAGAWHYMKKKYAPAADPQE